MKFILINLLFLNSSFGFGQTDTISKIDEGLLNTVVNIQKGQFTGSGFVVGRKNPNAFQFFLVTNKHMIGDFNYVDPFTIDSAIQVSFYTTDMTNNHISVKILLKDLANNILNTVKIHPSPTIDIAVIDITEHIRKIPNWKLHSSVDTSFLIKLKDIENETILGLGSQVFALGYPAGLKLESSNQPIAKAGYIASSLKGNLRVKLFIENKKKKIIPIIPDGKYFLVDGLIVGGNSGGPIICPQEQQTKIVNDKIYYRKTQNLFIGIVSANFNNTGITIVFSSDNIREVINSFPIN